MIKVRALLDGQQVEDVAMADLAGDTDIQARIFAGGLYIYFKRKGWL
ncbi:MAG TPA: hypothetical protein VFS70_13225 [Actinomycetota bacterium]|nr:hypothetical protein [Actinomycetota bacterium]